MADKWHVIGNGQREVTVLAPNGSGFTDIIEITYQIDTGPAAGNVFTAKVPKVMYTPENVRQIIDAQTANHNDIAGL